MKRICKFTAVLAVALAGSAMMLAQGTNDAFVGTWKLNLAKSKFTGVRAPKSTTRTIERQGKGTKITYEGVAADGSPIAFTVTTNLDGKPAPISGSGVGGGADMAAIKHIDSHTETSITTKHGKVVAHLRTVVSRDGNVTTQTVRGTDSHGKPYSEVMVWDKQ
jgi:hypothetical protein